MNPMTSRIALLMAASTMALSASAAMAASTSNDSTVTEVIVTAQKRSENLQKVPVAIAVATQDQLNNNAIGNAESLEEIIPSLTFKKGTANVNSTLSIRGIGTQSFSSGAEPSVSTVVDGVVYGRSGMAVQEFTDLDHIEVLAGPQGTLFGKNASAGVVNILTKGPTVSQVGDASVGIYEGGETRLDFNTSGPITDKIGYSLSGIYGDYRGNILNTYDERMTNGYRHKGLRGALVDQINDSLKVTLRADYVKADDNCCADVLGPYIPGSSPFNNILVPAIAPVKAVWGSKAVDDNLTPGTRDDNGGLSAQIDYAWNNFKITSISAWRDWRNKQIRDGDFHATAANYANGIDIADADYGELNYNQFSQELRIASPDTGKLQYVAGAFLWYTTENDWFNRYVTQCTASTLAADATGYKPCSAAPGVSTIINAQGPASWYTEFENQALFGQATYDVTDQLRLIGGLRFSHDHVSYSLSRVSTVPAGAGIQPSFSGAESADKNGVSGKAGAEYQINNNEMLYATYSRGYKGPSLNDYYSENKVNMGTIAPETSNNYEIGAKSQFFGHRLTLNGDVFWEDFSNFQANTFVLNPATSTTTVTLGDAGNVRSRGLELNAVWRATSTLSFNGGYTYDNAYIVTYNCNAAASIASTSPTNSNNQSLAKCVAHDGKVLPFAPKNKFNVTGNYDAPVPANWPFDLRISATYSYSSMINFDLDQSQLARQPSYGLFDATMAFTSKDGRYRLTLIGKNLGDQYYTTFITPGGTGPAAGTLNPLQAGSFTRLQVPRDAQRYVGAKLTVNF